MRSVLLALALTTAAVLVGPPAQAADSSYAGKSGWMNVWQMDGYGGCYEGRESYDTDFANDYCSFPATFNDRVSSFVNKTGSWWILYVDRGFAGARVCVRPHSHDGNIGNDTAYEDDISSMQKLGTAKPAGCTDTTGTAN